MELDWGVIVEYATPVAVILAYQAFTNWRARW
jgi:hypothetical protein